MIAWAAALLVCIAAATPLDGVQFEPIAPCAGAHTAPLVPARVVRVALYRGVGVSEREAAAAAAGAVAFWGRYGVAVTVSESAPVDFAAALAGDGVLAPSDGFRRWVAARAAEPLEAGVDVVVLGQIAAPGSAALATFDRLDGLTLTADQLAADAGTRALARALGLPERCPPTVLIGLGGWRRRRPADADTLTAHELGHAFGLAHTRAPGDLMTPGAHRCLPYLSSDERKRLTLP